MPSARTLAWQQAQRHIKEATLRPPPWPRTYGRLIGNAHTINGTAGRTGKAPRLRRTWLAQLHRGDT